MRKILLIIIVIVFGSYLLALFKGNLLIKEYVRDHRPQDISSSTEVNNLRPTPPTPKNIRLSDEDKKQLPKIKKKKINELIEAEENSEKTDPETKPEKIINKHKPKIQNTKKDAEVENENENESESEEKPVKKVPELEIETVKEDIERDNRTRIFCMIKSYLKNYKSNKTSLIYNVWGRKCDEHRVIMMIPEEFRTPEWEAGKEFEVLGKPFNILQPKTLVEETHAKVTEKIYHAFISIFKRFPNYPWYYLVDDDTYVNMNNMKEFLSDKDPSEPITFGFNFRVNVVDGYHSGGTGYVISNEAFKRIGRKLRKNFAFCRNSGVDDVDVNACLRTLGTKMGKSIDDLGRQKFLVVGMMAHFYGHYPDWLYDYTMYPISKGYTCCSDSLIAVHYMNPKEVLRLDIAIEVQSNILNMYKRHLKFKKKITFKDIIMSYIALEDFEFGSDYRLKSFLKVKINED